MTSSSNEEVLTEQPLVKSLPQEAKPKSNTTLIVVLVSIIFFFLGGIIVFLFMQLSNKENVLTEPTITVTQTLTETATTTPPTSTITVTQTESALKTYHSDELAITFSVPIGVEIKEVDDHYNVDGCIDTGTYPTYKAIKAYKNNKEILFIGVLGDCGATLIGTETKYFEKTVNGNTYTLWVKPEADNFGYLIADVRFGDLSKVVQGKVRSNDAIMRAQTGDYFTREEFDDAVTIISSIEKD